MRWLNVLLCRQAIEELARELARELIEIPPEEVVANTLLADTVQDLSHQVRCLVRLGGEVNVPCADQSHLSLALLFLCHAITHALIVAPLITHDRIHVWVLAVGGGPHPSGDTTRLGD